MIGSKELMLGLYLVSLAFFIGCSDSQEISRRIDQAFLEKHPITDLEEIYNSDLAQYQLAGDFLASNWAYDQATSFYVVESISHQDLEFLIYYLVGQEDHEILEVRLATFKGEALAYNYVVWKATKLEEDYTLLQINNATTIAQIFQNDDLLATYDLNNGKLFIQ